MIIYISWFVTRPYSNTTQCLRTLASPKGRGGMLSGRLKYIIKKTFLSLDTGIKCYIGMFCLHLVDVTAISGDDFLQARPERAAGSPDQRLA